MGLFSFDLSKRFVAIALAVMLVAGCGGEEGDDASAASGGSSGSGSGGGSASASLAISGSPPAQILEGSELDFTPTVSNPDGVSLTFSATNLPGWASISPTTGRITGTPGAGDVAAYFNIRVSVSGGGSSATSPAYSIEVVAAASASATLSWLAPTEKTDGSSLTNLAGYKIYYGRSQSNLNQSVTIDNPGITTYVIDNLTPATWYFAATAYDVDGMESAFSNTASKTIM